MTVFLRTNTNNKVNCLKCKHYAVTWNPKFPNTCKLLGFKSAAMPSTVAYNSTGKVCEGFQSRDAQKTNNSNTNVDSKADTQGVIVSIGDNEKRF